MDHRQELLRHYQWLRRFGINDSHSGNASVRDGARIWVTPTGACADTLRADDLIACSPAAPPPPGASLDAALHLAVYRAIPEAGAVLHSHGPYSLAMTFAGADFCPPDFEGQLYFPQVPVLTVPYERYMEEAPQRVAACLARHPICVVRGHGVYSWGSSINLAYKWTCSLEQSAKTCWLARQAGTLPTT
jgi:L-fuculose-phosphate aldolase